MPGRITTPAVQAMLNHRFGQAYMYAAPYTYFVGLSTTQPNPDGTGFTEPVGNGYARVAYANNVTNFPNMVGREKKNGAAITFPTATGTYLARTSVRVATAAGATVLPVGSVTDLAVDDQVTVARGTAVEETRVITAVNATVGSESITVNTALTHAHAAAEAVEEVTSWGLITHFLLFDNQTLAGAVNLHAYGQLDTPVRILAGETRSFAIGALVISAPGT